MREGCRRMPNLRELFPKWENNALHWVIGLTETGLCFCLKRGKNPGPSPVGGVFFNMANEMIRSCFQGISKPGKTVHWPARLSTSTFVFVFYWICFFFKLFFLFNSAFPVTTALYIFKKMVVLCVSFIWFVKFVQFYDFMPALLFPSNINTHSLFTAAKVIELLNNNKKDSVKTHSKNRSLQPRNTREEN